MRRSHSSSSGSFSARKTALLVVVALVIFGIGMQPSLPSSTLERQRAPNRRAKEIINGAASREQLPTLTESGYRIESSTPLPQEQGPAASQEETEPLGVEPQHNGHSEQKHDAADNSPSAPTVKITFHMGKEMEHAWRTSSKRLTFPTSLALEVDHRTRGAAVSGSATFYGKSSLKLKYTFRRSIQVKTATPLDFGFNFDSSSPSTDSSSATKLSNFLLMSLWEDKYRLAYRSSAQVLKSLGLFYSQVRLVELCYTTTDQTIPTTLGVYLLLEYPSDAIQRTLSSGVVPRGVCDSAHSHQLRRRAMLGANQDGKVGFKPAEPVPIGARNYIYFEKGKDPYYELLDVPSFARNSTLSKLYSSIEKDQSGAITFRPMGEGTSSSTSGSGVSPSGEEEDNADHSSKVHFDFAHYMLWVAVNTALRNGDYDDEVFFFKQQNYFSIMAWDYDTIFSPCHRDGKTAIRSEMMFCAETPLEKAIQQSFALTKQYLEALECVLTGPLSAARWKAALETSGQELEGIYHLNPKSKEVTFAKKDGNPDYKAGIEELVIQMDRSRTRLMGLLPKQSREEHSGKLPAGGGAVEVGRLLQQGEGTHDRDAHHPADQQKRQGVLKHGTSVSAQCKQAIELVDKIPAEQKHQFTIAGDANGKGKKRESKPSPPPSSSVGVPLRVITPLLDAVSIGGEEGVGFSPEALNAAGLYCVSPQPSSCPDGFSLKGRTVVVRGARGSAEFGVPPWEKPEPLRLQSSIHDIRQARPVKLAVSVPKRWPYNPNAGGGSFNFPMLVSVEGEDRTWVRLTLPVTLKGRQRSSEALVLRGFSASWVTAGNDGQKELPLELSSFGPEFHLTEESTAQGELQLTTPPGANPTAGAIVQPFHFPDRFNKEDAIAFPADGAVDLPAKLDGAAVENPECLIKILSSQGLVIKTGKQLVISAGCTLLMEPGAIITVEKGALLHLEGSSTEPIQILPFSDTNDPTSTVSAANESPKQKGAQAAEKERGRWRKQDRWATILVKDGGKLKLEWSFLVGSGQGRPAPGTGTHHSSSAAVTILAGGELHLQHSSVLDSLGPAIAAGHKSRVTVIDSIVQWAHMGIECIECDFLSKGSTWANFPNWRTEYEDNDNDAMYLSGGTHRVSDTVIMNTKDDGIDTGTPEKHQGDGGTLSIDRTVIENVAHEGIALSSAVKSKRIVRISNTLVNFAQQAVESGYTGREHEATVESSMFTNCFVGLRYGDNYFKRPQQGQLAATNISMRQVKLPVVNYIRSKQGPQKDSVFRFRNIRVDTASSESHAAGLLSPCSDVLPASSWPVKRGGAPDKTESVNFIRVQETSTDQKLADEQFSADALSLLGRYARS